MENLRKSLIYFKSWDSYWKLTDKSEILAVNAGKCGRYPLDFKPRIIEGHYPFFDSKGVPMWPDSEGKKYLYHYTTMCSFALGHNDFYYLTGDVSHLSKLKAVAEYIVNSAIETKGEYLLVETDENNNHTGNVSAMAQGEGISVLCRAGELTGDNLFVDTALKMTGMFRRSIDERGVLGFITSADSYWYEEYVSPPLNHVLNGMIYSLWGLRDLYGLTGFEDAEKLYKSGVNYVEKCLPYFDSGYWSYYWIPENGVNYTSSMMYHNLHICQLKALYEQTGNATFKDYAEKFISYAKNPICRAKAAKDMIIAKFGRSE